MTPSRASQKRFWVARKQIPARLRAAYTAAFGKGWAEKFARPASLSEQEVRVAFAEWLAPRGVLGSKAASISSPPACAAQYQ